MENELLLPVQEKVLWEMIHDHTCTLKKLIHSVLTEPTLFATICECRRDGSMILRVGYERPCRAELGERPCRARIFTYY